MGTPDCVNEEREFVVDSGASMHMVSKNDRNSAELETMRTSRRPTTVMTANGEVQTREEATENDKQLDDCNISNYVPLVVPGLSASSSRIPYLMSTETPKIQYQKEVEVRVKSFGETRCIKPQKPKK